MGGPGGKCSLHSLVPLAHGFGGESEPQKGKERAQSFPHFLMSYFQMLPKRKNQSCFLMTVAGRWGLKGLSVWPFLPVKSSEEQAI